MSSETTPHWDFIETRDVGSNRKITMPTELRTDFVVTNRVGDNAVLWYWLMSAGVALLTTGLLEKGEYQRFGYRRYFDSNQFQFPKDLDHELTYSIEEGNKAVFLAHEDMLAESPKSVYILSDDKALDLLEQPVTDDLVTSLKQQPAFFGPV